MYYMYNFTAELFEINRPNKPSPNGFSIDGWFLHRPNIVWELQNSNFSNPVILSTLLVIILL